MVHRGVIDRMLLKMKDQRVLIIYGPWQTGKTTILHMLAEILNDKVRWWNGDEPNHCIQLQNLTSTELRGVKVIAPGSSAFDLADKISKPLTGRKWEFFVHPFSHLEMTRHSSPEELAGRR